MRIIYQVNPACDCRPKVERFAQECARTGQPLDIGSIVECDCGQEYKLTDSQRDGRHWAWFHSDSAA